MKRKTALAAAAIAIFALLVTSLISLEWSMRPVVAYKITGYDCDVPGLWVLDFNPYGGFSTTTMPQVYTFVNSGDPLMIDLNWENKGCVVASVQLTVTSTNANITWISNFSAQDNENPMFWGTEADGQTYNGTSFSFLSSLNGQSGLQQKFINIMPIGKPQNFTIAFSVKGMSNFFFSLCPSGTITVTYELTNSNVYQIAS